jgi:hypothetical protein
MGSIGIAAFGGAKGVPILGVIVFFCCHSHRRDCRKATPKRGHSSLLTLHF